MKDCTLLLSLWSSLGLENLEPAQHLLECLGYEARPSELVDEHDYLQGVGTIMMLDA